MTDREKRQNKHTLAQNRNHGLHTHSGRFRGHKLLKEMEGEKDERGNERVIDSGDKDE